MASSSSPRAKLFTAVAASFILGYSVATFGSPLIYHLRVLLINSFTSSDTELNNNIEDVVTCMTLPCHLDQNNHMNNAMYIYELNFSRRRYFYRIGLWPILHTNQCNLIVACQTIRYRREIGAWTKYNIRTKIVGYNDQDMCFWVQSYFEEYCHSPVISSSSNSSSSSSNSSSSSSNSSSSSSTEPFILAVHMVKYKLVSVHVSVAIAVPAPSDLLKMVGLSQLVPSADTAVQHNVPCVDCLANINLLR